MSGLRLKREIAARLVWSKHDSSIAPFCSVCQAHIPNGRRRILEAVENCDPVPLMMWNQRGDCVQFCDDCAANAFECYE